MRHVTLIIAVLALALASPAFSGKGGNSGGNGNGNGSGNAGSGGGGNVVPPPSSSCSVDGNVVTGAGLPNWTLLNFMVTDASGTTGWVLGYTDDGTRTVTVPARSGPTRYEFAGETYGKDGSRYDVFATCSA